MSHWKKFESNVLENVEESLLEKALSEMGLQMDRNITNITNSWGNETVSAGLVKNGRAIPLGFNFVESDGKVKLELSGDFYQTGLNEEGFIDLLAQTYQKYNVEDKLGANGYNIDEILQDSEGNIVIEAYQWA